MRLSSLADYAVVMMAAAARPSAGRRNATQLAEETGLPLPTVQKLVSRLSASGLLESSRGTGGGFALARAPERISVADVVEAVEGPIALTTCVDEARHDCVVEGACRVRAHWPLINGAVRAALAGVTLADLVLPSPPLAVDRADGHEPAPLRSDPSSPAPAGSQVLA